MGIEWSKNMGIEWSKSKNKNKNMGIEWRISRLFQKTKKEKKNT